GQAVREARLKCVGGCRHAEDRARLAALQQYAVELGIADDVDWVVNAPFSELKALLGGAVGGLHTMVDEHFGISVVEYMAAGVVPIAHNS
ncbi:GDP-Man:Man(3)GlcNAc(2)-PP-Dol alpha-1,2-mannosyltransferase, partial [Tetrabaena socialis]